MQVNVTFRNMDDSESVVNFIKQRAQHLSHICSRLLNCQAVVEAPHRHHRKGNLYHVRLSFGGPGKDIIVSRKGSHRASHKVVYVAIRDVFEAAEKQIKHHVFLGHREQAKRRENYLSTKLVAFTGAEAGRETIAT